MHLIFIFNGFFGVKILEYLMNRIDNFLNVFIFM